MERVEGICPGKPVQVHFKIATSSLDIVIPMTIAGLVDYEYSTLAHGKGVTSYLPMANNLMLSSSTVEDDVELDLNDVFNNEEAYIDVAFRIEFPKGTSIQEDRDYLLQRIELFEITVQGDRY